MPSIIDLPEAQTPLNDDDLAVVFQDGRAKKVNKEQFVRNAEIDDAVLLVANNMDAIIDVALAEPQIDIVAENIDDVVTVGVNIDPVILVAENIDNIISVAEAEIENIDDRMAEVLQPTANGALTWAYNDVAGTITPTIVLTPYSTSDLTEGTNQYYTAERVDDRVNALIQPSANSALTWTYDDVGGTLTPAVSLTPYSTTNLSEGSNLYYTDERVDDRVSALIQNGTGISWSYNDGSNTFTPTVTLAPFSTTNLSEGSNLYFTDERAQDAVGTILTDTSTIDLTYNDGSNTITADVIDDSITYAKIQNVTQARVLGRAAGAGSGDTTELTAAQLQTILGVTTTSTDNAVARFDGTTGGLQNSGVIVDDTNNVSGIGTLAAGKTTITSTTANQLVLAYDVSNTVSFDVESDGDLVINATGTSVTFNDLIRPTGGIQSSNSGDSSNFRVSGTSAGSGVGSGSSDSKFLIGGSSTTSYRTALGGDSATAIGANRAYASLLIGSALVTEATTGTHPIFASLAVKAPIITGAAGGLTNGATVYIEGATTGDTTSRALWVDSGETKLDGTLIVDGVISSAASVALTGTTNNVGTITTGVWNGTPLTTTYAGVPTGGASGEVLTKNSGSNYDMSWASVGIADGDKGDITVSGSGATWTVDNDAITYAKIQNVTNNRILGRTAGTSGDIEELNIDGVLSLLGTTQGQIIYRGASNWAALNPGTDGQFLETNGAAANPSWSTASGRLIKTTVYTSTQSWTPDAAAETIIVRMRGAGGGGGGAFAANGASAGGGGGGYSERRLTKAQFSTGQTVTLGAGGTAGSSAGGTGGTGGTSSFGSFISITGGTGGTGISTAIIGFPAGSGGTASSGDLNIKGAGGGLGDVTGQFGGQGGGEGGGSQTAGSTPVNGAANSGGGGSGLYRSAGSIAGGVGAVGWCVVEEYT